MWVVELQAAVLTAYFPDTAGDRAGGGIDLIGLRFTFDNSTGDYAIILYAARDDEFLGDFRVDVNLFNADIGTTAPDPAFFVDDVNEFSFAVARRHLVMLGNNPRLLAWAAGERIAISGPDPLGVPDGVTGFTSGVRNPAAQAGDSSGDDVDIGFRPALETIGNGAVTLESNSSSATAKDGDVGPGVAGVVQEFFNDTSLPATASLSPVSGTSANTTAFTLQASRVGASFLVATVHSVDNSIGLTGDSLRSDNSTSSPGFQLAIPENGIFSLGGFLEVTGMDGLAVRTDVSFLPLSILIPGGAGDTTTSTGLDGIFRYDLGVADDGTASNFTGGDFSGVVVGGEQYSFSGTVAIFTKDTAGSSDDVNDSSGQATGQYLLQVAATHTTDEDGDGDGIPDDEDNCSAFPNTDQRDTDADGFGNVCDADLNGDCVINFGDLGVMKSAFFTADPDADLDDDGIVGFGDLGVLRIRFFSSPGPSGAPNVCDSL